MSAEHLLALGIHVKSIEVDKKTGKPKWTGVTVKHGKKAMLDKAQVAYAADTVLVRLDNGNRASWKLVSKVLLDPVLIMPTIQFPSEDTKEAAQIIVNSMRWAGWKDVNWDTAKQLLIDYFVKPIKTAYAKILIDWLKDNIVEKKVTALKVPKEKIEVAPKRTIIDICILDVSLSMEQGNRIGTAIAGLNSYIKTQQDSEHSANILMQIARFGVNTSTRQALCSVCLINPITSEIFTREGQTRTYDALYTQIVEIEEYIARHPEYKDASVTITIFTDGEENSSSEVTKTKCIEAVNRATANKWTIALIMACESGHHSAKEFMKKLGLDDSNLLATKGDAKSVEDSIGKYTQSRGAKTEAYMKSGQHQTIGFFSAT